MPRQKAAAMPRQHAAALEVPKGEFYNQEQGSEVEGPRVSGPWSIIERGEL